LHASRVIGRSRRGGHRRHEGGAFGLLRGRVFARRPGCETARSLKTALRRSEPRQIWKIGGRRSNSSRRRALARALSPQSRRRWVTTRRQAPGLVTRMWDSAVRWTPSPRACLREDRDGRNGRRRWSQRCDGPIRDRSRQRSRRRACRRRARRHHRPLSSGTFVHDAHRVRLPSQQRLVVRDAAHPRHRRRLCACRLRACRLRACSLRACSRRRARRVRCTSCSMGSTRSMNNARCTQTSMPMALSPRARRAAPACWPLDVERRSGFRANRSDRVAASLRAAATFLAPTR
jgi:hypothetical protein